MKTQKMIWLIFRHVTNFSRKISRRQIRACFGDEMQDMNAIHAQIIEKIAKNLFLVGDPKQAIFGFGGGSIKNFEKFAQSAKKCCYLKTDEAHNKS